MGLQAGSGAQPLLHMSLQQCKLGLSGDKLLVVPNDRGACWLCGFIDAGASSRCAAAAGFDLSLIPEGSRVLLDGIVLQERARNTRSASALKHGFRKLVWKEVKLSLTDIEVILQKEQYSQKSSNVTVDGAEPLVLGRVQLKDIESCGSITDVEGGWWIEATNLLVQFRAATAEEAESWMMAIAHNAAAMGGDVKRADKAYDQGRAWDYALHSPKYAY